MTRAGGPSARQANADTFHFTNAAPQAAVFNQSKELWNGLEDHLLAYATANTRRLVVHTGPVLAPDDRAYRGVQIPRQFFKVVGFLDDVQPPEAGRSDPAATGCVLDQSPQLDEIDLRTAGARLDAAGAPPPLGPYRTFQAPVPDIAAMTGLDFGALADADRFLRPDRPSATAGLWRELSSYDDISWTKRH